MLIYGGTVGALALTSFVAYDEHADQSSALQRAANIGGTVARFFGSSRVLFSVVFILSIFNYFVFSLQDHLEITEQQVSVLLLIVFWGVVLLIEPIDRALIQPVFNSLTKTRHSRIIGRVVRRTSPNIVVAEQLAKMPSIAPGTLLALGNASRSYADSDERHALMYLYSEDSGDRRFSFFYSLSGTFDHIADRTSVHMLDKSVQDEMLGRLAQNALIANRDNLIGFIYAGSDINVIKIKMIEGVDEKKTLKDGDLVSVNLYGTPTKYQIINVQTANETVEGTSRQGTKIISAQQIGCWQANKQRFGETGWVPEMNSPVFVEGTAEPIPELDGGYYRVGVVPKSQYPIYVNLEDSVTHHIAIIGKTGTGKSRMAAHMLERMAACGYRVVILEIDRRQAQSLTRYIKQDLIEVQDSKQLDLSKAKMPIISVDFDIDLRASKESGTLNLSDMASSLIERIIGYQIKNEGQRICIVMEEAYDFIPESTFGHQGYGQPQVSRISQMVLKCRKHNIGFVIITQRTALVTKTILYQCHTIIALQSFDETSKNFMGAYISQQYLDSMSILPRFRAIVVGKGSSCDKPVIVDFFDPRLPNVDAGRAPSAPLRGAPPS